MVCCLLPTKRLSTFFCTTTPMLRKISTAVSKNYQTHSVPVVYFASRCFSTSKISNNEMFSEQSMQERKEKASTVIKQFFQKEYAYVNTLPFTLAQAKDAATEMIQALKNSDDALTTIAAMDSDIGKYTSLLHLFSQIRLQVMPKYDIKDESKFRLFIGQHAKLDDSVADLTRQFFAVAADKVYKVTLKPYLTDARAITLFQLALTETNYEFQNYLHDLMTQFTDTSKYEGNDYMNANFNNDAFIDAHFTPLMHQVELKLLKAEEDVQVELAKKNITHKNEEAKRLAEQAKSAAPALQTEAEIVRPVLASTEGWINYKFQVAEALYRYAKIN